MNRGSGPTVGRSFVDTVLEEERRERREDLAQYLRSAPEGVPVEACEGRIFTCNLPTRWEEKVAEGCVIDRICCLSPKKETCFLRLGLSSGIYSVGRGCFTPPFWGVGYSGVLCGGAGFTCACSWFCLGSSRHLPHSMGGTAALPLSICVWKRPRAPTSANLNLHGGSGSCVR